MNKILYLVLFMGLFASCKNDTKKSDATQKNEEVTIYTHRHYDIDKEIFAQFEKAHNIKVNVVNAKSDELIAKLEQEGVNTPGDVLITVDAGRLGRAKDKGLLQSFSSPVLDAVVPSHLRDTDKQWYGLTKRARVIAYAKDRVKPEQLSTYENLADKEWQDKLLIRSSGNIYNQSLMASIIANLGKEKASEWALGVLRNMARSPKGNDRDQVKAVVAGEGDLAVVNTYYIGKLLNGKDPKEVEAGEGVALFFPNQNDRGTHINVSGAGITKHSKNKENAQKFIEFLLSKEIQSKFAQENYEYPVNSDAEVAELLKSWGTFKEDNLSLTKLAEHNKDAVVVFDQVGWN